MQVRQTLLMLSTVFEDEAVESVLSATIPSPVVEWLMTNDAIFDCQQWFQGSMLVNHQMRQQPWLH